MTRLRAATLLAFALFAHGADAQQGAARLVLFADLGDEDDDGVADAAQAIVGAAASGALHVLSAAQGAKASVTALRGDAVRLLVEGRPAAAPAAGKALSIQGVHAGSAEVELDGSVQGVDVLEVAAFDEAGGRVDLATSHASFSRSTPAELALPDSSPEPDTDALSWVVAGPAASLPDRVDVVSTRPDGARLDQLAQVALHPMSCPAGFGAGIECRGTRLIRAVFDAVDRDHPSVTQRSLRAEVGGRLRVRIAGRLAASIRVGGPRSSALGDLARYRGRLRVRVVRLSPGGDPPIGADAASAVALARAEVDIASQVWGQCGVHFGLAGDLDVAVVDPPPAHLVAVGCDLAQPASGGTLTLRAGKKRIQLETRPGQTATEVASSLAAQLRRAGYVARISPNARTSPAAFRSVDVLVRDAHGGFVPLSADGDSPISSDASLTACLGEVDLADGVTHFSDYDAIAGTVEERSLIKAFEDDDPSTIEVIVIPTFATVGRIGESFIATDGGTGHNAILLDRVGIRAGARSYTLAHELGHVLLDLPGHPDDFGTDTAGLLMDADAADPSIFGPRRLPLSDCERALRQSGPGAPVPVLSAWPLTGARAK